jgi:hypothetical protein
MPVPSMSLAASAGSPQCFAAGLANNALDGLGLNGLLLCLMALAGRRILDAVRWC